MKILKFGGSSIADEEAIEKVLAIIGQRADGDELTIVISALKGVTDQLHAAAHEAAAAKASYRKHIKRLEERHVRLVKNIISVHGQSEALARLKLMTNELEDVLQGVFLVHEITTRMLDFIQGFGERLAAYLISRCLDNRGISASYADARDFIKTDTHFGQAGVLMEETNERIRAFFKDKDEVQVVTGFIGATDVEDATTLGRGGSDYTASLLGAALGAEVIEIWTDVDGLLTADPRKVERAFTIPALSFEEAMELSHFGAIVLYPPTLQPAMKADIPILIRNTFRPEQPGTRIGPQANEGDALIKGISSIDDIVLLTIRGSGMIGVTGVAERIFATLARQEINIILITQASSEHTVCLAVLPSFAEQAKASIE